MSCEPHTFVARLSAAWPVAEWQDVTVMLAASGGADSVALLRGMAELKRSGAGRLLVAHFNHRLRGPESDGDEQFVRELSAQLGLAVVCGRGDPDSQRAAPDGLEAAARAARYAFLLEEAEQAGARFLVTAHTADDQVETVLHRIVRGTGLAGLAGIPRVRALSPAVTLIRPILDMTRAEVVAYLHGIGQPYRTDSTNTAIHFTRNRIRRKLLPTLEREYSATVSQSLLRLAALAADAQRVIERLAAELLERATALERAEQIVLDCPAVAGQEPHLVRELFVLIWRRRAWPQQDMTYAHWQSLAESMLAAEARTAEIFPGGVQVRREGDRLVLARLG